MFTDLSTNTLYRANFYSTDTIYCGVFNEKHQLKTLILINKKWVANKNKSILAGREAGERDEEEGNVVNS